MAVTFLQATLIAMLCFGSGIVSGMLLYRVLWHLDSSVLRIEISDLKIVNRSLQSEIVRLSQELTAVQARLVEVESGARQLQDDLRASLRR